MPDGPPHGLYRTDTTRARAWLAAERDGLGHARDLLVAEAEVASAHGKHAFEAALLHDVVRFGGAADVLARLAELDGEVQGELFTARLDHATGKANDDPGTLEAAVDGLERVGAPLLAAEASTDLAHALRRGGDHRGATAATARAETLRRSGGRVVLLQGPALIRSAAVEPLTGREREVARLAARGASSKRIAEQLHLSVRTVDNHLQRAYTKLGVSSREQLPAALGLVDGEPA
jgi:DNA-binding CsgD family transcriptional regulator